MKKTLILGFGVSGRSAAALLRAQGRAVYAVDRKASELQRLVPDIPVFSEDAHIPWNEIEEIILSPGISPKHPVLMEARIRCIEVVGEIELALRYLRNPCIGITGTNGKTTTALLVTHLLNRTGHLARALGNIGTSLTSYALAPDSREILVIELSSYQLETMQTRCLDAALFLNLTPDHLDRYDSVEEYARAKSRIEGCLKPTGRLWISQSVAREWGFLFSTRPSLFDENVIEAISLKEYTNDLLKLGLPEQQNVAAARVLVQLFGVTDEEFKRELAPFRKPAHRIEYVGEKNGIAFYNDSKATNIDAVLHAMNQIKGSVILLAGGVDKGASYQPWKAFQSQIRSVVAFGQAAAKIEEDLRATMAVQRAQGLEEAVLLAIKQARPPVSIVLSPGCSSFDEFRNYEHRGNEFKRIVKEKIWIEEKRSSLPSW